MTVYSSHVDTFARDNLPPRDQWPDRIFTRPELQYPDRLNCIVELLDEHVIPCYSLNSANVLRLTPPAILDAADLDWLGHALISAAKHVARAMPAARLSTIP